MDEHGDPGSVASVAESSTVTVTMPSGDANMACGGQIEESCSGGDGEEIMIEVVGSDVFVDGVSGGGDGSGKKGLVEDMESFGNEGMVGGDKGSREVGDLGGQLSDGRIETGEVVAVEGLEVVPGSSIERTNVMVSRRVEVSVRGEVEGKAQGVAESVDGGDTVPGNQSQGTDGVSDDVWSPRIDAVIVSCTPKVKSQSAQGEIVEGSNMVGEEDWNRKSEILGADMASDSLQSSGKDASSVVKMIETISEASVKDIVSHASSKILKNPAEAIVGGHVGSSTPEENLPPATGGTESNVIDQNLRSSIEGIPMKDRAADNNSSPGNMDAKTLSFSELPNDTAGGGVASVNASVSLDGSLDTVGEHTLTDKNVCARSVSDTVLGTEPEFSIRNTEVVEQGEIVAGNIEDAGVEPEAPFSAEKKEATSHSEDFPSMKEETIFVSHGDIQTASESSLEPSSVVERGEWITMDIDEVLDFKDEPIIVDAPDASLGSAGHAEDISGISGKPIITPDHGDVATKAASLGDETCVKDTKIPKDFRGDGLVQSDSGISNEHTELSTGYTEVIANSKGANFRGEVSDGNESGPTSEQFNTLDVVEVSEKHVVTVANSVLSSEQNGKVISMEISVNSYEAVEVPLCDARPLLKNGNKKVEKEGAGKGEELRSDPKEGAEVEVCNDAVQGTDSNVEVNTSIPDQKPEVVESPMHEVHVDQTKDTFVVDKIQNEVAYTDPISNVQVSTGSESGGVSEAEGKLTESKSKCSHSNDDDMMQVDIPEFKSTEDQQDIGIGKQNSEDGQLDYREQDILCGENASEMDWSNKVEEKTTKLPSLLSIHQEGYFLPPGNEGEFSITDLVWGKVRSHPWWPGQIFDPADASEKAVKYYKKDCFLVAYFGDHTFAWNDASLLKPFQPHFSHIEKQSNSEAFQNAVSCALDEVSRRVELGLSCSCIPADAYDKLECQIVENTGIREESSRRNGVDKSTGATSFEPDKLLQYMRSLAELPFSLVDRLELVLAKAQLSAFCHFKGYREPPTFETRDATFENDAQNLSSIDAVDQSVPVSKEDEQLSSSQKHRQDLKDNLHHRKERSLSELMGDVEYSPEDEECSDGKALSKSVSTTSGKKRKAVDSLTDGSDRRTTFYAAKVSTTSTCPKPSFKVGDCIRRVASQLTGSMPILKGHNDQAGTVTSLPISEDPQEGIMVIPSEISSSEEMLSQLQLAARDPKKGYGFLSNIIIFFSGFRNSVVRKHTSVGRSSGGRKRKANHTSGGFTEEFEFDDVNDSYWTDRIVQNYSEEQLLQNNEHADRNYQMVASDPNRVHKSGRGSHSRKRYSNGNYEVSADEQLEDVDRKNLEASPAELVLTFAEGDPLPSEIKLNKMFRRFGPLMESETEVNQDSRRARVIFKRGADAEVACSSAGRINIFGSMQVSYQLSYLPSATFSSLPLLMLQGS